MVGLVWAILFDSSIDLGDVGAILLGGLLTFGIWNARSWAFVWLFAGAILCALGGLIYLMSRPENIPGAIPGIVITGVMFLLLLHPSTKRYTLRDRRALGQSEIATQGSAPQPMTAPTPLGVRRNTVVALGFLLLAITIAGVFGVMRAWSLASL